MAKIIELTGPPGVGKSTYYDALVAQWTKQSNWQPAEHFYPSQKINYTNPRTFVTSFFQKAIRKIDSDAFNDAGRRFVANYPEFVDAVFEDISLNKRDVYGKDLRLHDASFLYSSFQRIQLLLDCKTEKFILKAEGIVHRIPHSVNDDELTKDRRVVVSLLDKIPMPAAVIYLTCDVEENAKRLATRKFVWDGHRNLSLTRLQEYSRRSHEKRDMIIDVLREHRVPLLKIDTTIELQKGIETILNFLNTL